MHIATQPEGIDIGDHSNEEKYDKICGKKHSPPLVKQGQVNSYLIGGLQIFLSGCIGTLSFRT